MSNRAWVTLATNDSYGLGALVLAHSLRRVSSSHPAVVLITPSVTDAMRERLREVFAEVVIVDVLDSKDAAHLALLQRPELGITFTKIHCWGLTQYEKCVFLDADTLVVQNCDELFEREELSAAPDVGWPDCFNSGVFVYKPSSETFEALIKFAQERGSFDGGDQGLLNSFFADWARADINKHLPFLYNVTSAAFYSYLPALKHYGQNLKIIHFIGAAKPWLQQYNWQSRSVDAPDHLRELLQLWWDLFVGQVHHQLDAAMVDDFDVEASPALPPPDVAQHYAPTLDPESEFPWHHPDAQVPQDSQAYGHKVDLTQFHDPWQNYRGNIPPNPDPEVLDDRQALRDYAWDYQPSQELISNVWQKSSGHSSHNPTEHHNKPTHDHHHSHSHSEHSWENHSHKQSHGNWHQEHEAGHFFTSHEHPVKSEPEDAHEHGYHEHSHSEYPHDHHYDHKSHHNHDHSLHEQSHQNESSTESQNDHRVIHQDFSHPQVEYITNRPHLHIVHHLHVDYDSTPDQREEEDMPLTINGVNDDSSETDSGDYEDIKPRHPYDNYYLKHRATIDSYGRKICSHEIPPSPSHSPPPEATYADSPSPEEIDAPSGVENQSGVAGNLARVVPGATHREALDELTRRQGWEAGNIDYMGADSFDNIWAKISQTLSQPRSSPPKDSTQPPKEPTPPPKEPTPPPKEPTPQESAPKQPSPPKESPPVEAKPDTLVEKKPEVPVEVAVEAAGKEIPVTSAAVPAAAPALAPVELVAVAPAPVASAPVAPEPVAPAPVAPLPVAPEPVAPAPVAPEPVAPAPVTPAPVAPAPVAPALVAPATVAPASIKSAAVEAPAAVQAPAEVEASAPVEAAAPAVPAPEALVKLEAAAPAPEAKKSTEKTDKVPATPPATPKTSPEPSTPGEPPAQPGTPEKALEAPAASDSPPLAHTPSKDQAPAPPAAKSEERERRKPAGKLLLSPPSGADPLATPDSELEDAAALASSIIAGELRAPTVSAATPSDPEPASPAGAEAAERLSVEEPELPTPPVSLAQIGVKPKAQTTAAQIESSVSEPATPPTPPGAPDAPKEAPKKKIVKKTAKKEGDAPVPPPRKKEKKPKDK